MEESEVMIETLGGGWETVRQSERQEGAPVRTANKLIVKTAFETASANRLLLKIPTAWKRKITGKTALNDL